MSGIAHQSAFPGSQEDGWGIYHVWHEEESGVDMPCLNAKMYSPKMGFNQAYSCALESLQSCPWSSPLKKMSAPKEMMQTSHCRSCNCNTCQSIFGVDPGLQQDGHSFSKPLFQGIGHLKPTHCLLLSRMSSSAPLRFVWLKFNPIELREADEPCAAAPWASREQGGLHTEPRGWRTAQARLVSASCCLQLLISPELRCDIPMGRMM